MPKDLIPARLSFPQAFAGRIRFQEDIVKKNKKIKLKTHRGAAKRFKITSTGKIMRWHSGKRHLLGTK